MSSPLFDPSLINSTVASSLPSGYTLRPLYKSDYSEFLDVLRVLTAVGDISEEEWGKRYDWMATRNEEYFVLCITDDKGKVVAVGSLIVEKKLYRLR
jgi:glucosamine-phosphate N-acetyltransferase